jgi:hypothetical protein
VIPLVKPGGNRADSLRESCLVFREDRGSLGPADRVTETEIDGQCGRGHWPGEEHRSGMRPVGRHSIKLGWSPARRWGHC